MELVDISEVSPALFIVGALFILLIGSALSLGVLRLFQEKKTQGIWLLVLAVVSVAALVVVMNTWFV
ncbi:hypothetical protein SD71_20105 [Cohnella kolymensis]|uniref:Signal transduction histidine kinase n=1 Tax=Cohnella kolymensis TaxID=1590652 RepID=A0ABR5A1B5_9BACL|nr:hypothetical protein [Cohnella kolymensis]KIL34345.1 hypothetical protein SD71_20105 [Cohnella kolymensis]